MVCFSYQEEFGSCQNDKWARYFVTARMISDYRKHMYIAECPTLSFHSRVSKADAGLPQIKYVLILLIAFITPSANF